jgi:hypothetical protein
MGNVTVHSGPPTSLSAHGRFRPIGPLSQPPAPARLPRAAPSLTARWGPPCVTPTSSSSSSLLPLWLTPAPKRWPRRSWPPSRRAPRPPGASLPSTYPRATAAIRSRRRDPHGTPNPSRLGGIQSPAHLPAAGGEGEEEEENGGARSSTARREAGAAREEEPDPREPSTPATPASSASSSPRRLPASATSAASFLVTTPHTPFTDAYTSARGHPGEDAVSPPLWTPRPSSRGGTFRATAPPRRCW